MAKKHTRVRVLLPLLFSALAASAFAGSTVVGSVVSSTETVIGGHPVFVGNTVFSGDTLKIGDGAAEVALAGGSLIILARETEATFERESDRVTVQLGRGMVTLRSGADEAARIRLAVGGIMVEPARGTATLAQVSLSGRDVTVSTKEGSLEVERFGRRVELPKGKAIKILPANQAPSPSAGNPQGIGLGRLAECAALGGIVSVAPVAVIHVISPSQPNWEWGLTPIGPVAGALICMELPPPPPPNPGAPGNPPKCELAADPAEIETPGTEVKLTWKYPEGSKGVKLWEGGRIKQDLNDPSGSVTVNPRSDTNYSVQGKGPDGKDFKCQATVALRPFKCDLCARYDETTGKFTLRWTAKKASSAVLRAYTLGSPPEEIPGEAYEAPAGKVEEGDKEVDQSQVA
ncbi:MAG: FecR domain-containing protein [Candidatus Solibacter sp.]